MLYKFIQLPLLPDTTKNLLGGTCFSYSVMFSVALSSLINEHSRLFFSRKKPHLTRSYFRPFFRQVAPNFAYLFIKFEEKFQPTRLFQSTRLLESWEWKRAKLRARRRVARGAHSGLIQCSVKIIVKKLFSTLWKGLFQCRDPENIVYCKGTPKVERN